MVTYIFEGQSEKTLCIKRTQNFKTQNFKSTDWEHHMGIAIILSNLSVLFEQDQSVAC